MYDPEEGDVFCKSNEQMSEIYLLDFATIETDISRHLLKCY